MRTLVTGCQIARPSCTERRSSITAIPCALAPLVRTFPHAGVLTRAVFALGIVGTGLLAVPILAGSAGYGVFRL